MLYASTKDTKVESENELCSAKFALVFHSLFADHNLCFFLKERLIWGLRLNVFSLLWQFEPEKVLKVFLSYLLYSVSINRCGLDQDTYQREICALRLIVLNENKNLQLKSDTT